MKKPRAQPQGDWQVPNHDITERRRWRATCGVTSGRVTTPGRPSWYNEFMTSPFLDLLKQIDEGIQIFEPFRRTSRELVEFQDLVARILEMESLGLIKRTFTQKREIAGAEYYDLIMVLGGLTAEGERLLAEHRGPGQS